MAASRSNRLLQLAREIVQREQELAWLRAEFERLAGDQRAEDIAGEQKLVLRPLARTSNLPTRVQSVLDVTPHPMTAPDIAARLGESVDSVRSALSKLLARECIERVSTGIYRSLPGHRQAAGEDD